MSEEQSGFREGGEQRLVIATVANRPYLIADNAIISQIQGPADYIELIALAFQSHYEAQDFTMVIDQEGDQAMKAGNVVGGMRIQDQGAMRFTPKGAEDMAVGMLRHLVKIRAHTKAEIMARLEAEIDG